MHVDDHGRLVARLEERVPVVVRVVDGGQAQVGRDLREADRVHATRRIASDLCGGQLRVPQRHDDQRNQATSGAGAPLFHLIVVVGLDAQKGELFVLGLGEGLAAEAREGREAEGRLDVVGVHVLEALFLAVGARAHVLVGDALHGDFVTGYAHGGVDSQQRALQVLVVPPVGRSALGPRLHRQLAADEGDLPHGGPHNAGAHVVILGRDAIRPGGGGLDDVVVDGDDHRQFGHGEECTPASDGVSVPGGVTRSR